MTANRNSVALIRAAPIHDRRALPRHRGSTIARIETRLGASTVDILDLSCNGACFVLRNGVAPEVGAPVRLSLIGMACAEGTIVWTCRDRFGVFLNKPIGDPELWLDPVAHGQQYLAAIIRFQLERHR